MSALSKLNMGAAACAIAAAATLTATPVAQAQPTVASAPTSAVGGQVGQLSEPECVTVTGAPCAAAVVSAAAVPSPGDFVRGIFQNELWWIGPANPNPPAQATILQFTPMSLIPGFLKPVYGWFTQNLNFEACFLGASVKVGPYGTTTLSVGRGCK